MPGQIDLKLLQIEWDNYFRRPAPYVIWDCQKTYDISKTTKITFRKKTTSDQVAFNCSLKIKTTETTETTRKIKMYCQPKKIKNKKQKYVICDQKRYELMQFKTPDEKKKYVLYDRFIDSVTIDVGKSSAYISEKLQRKFSRIQQKATAAGINMDKPENNPMIKSNSYRGIEYIDFQKNHQLAIPRAIEMYEKLDKKANEILLKKEEERHAKILSQLKKQRRKKDFVNNISDAFNNFYNFFGKKTPITQTSKIPNAPSAPPALRTQSAQRQVQRQPQRHMQHQCNCKTFNITINFFKLRM